MLTIILMILGYLVIGGITTGVINVIFNDYDVAVVCGFVWPFAIPLIICLLIITAIGGLISAIVNLIS